MILEEIAARTVQRVAEEKAAVPLSEMKKRAEALDANTGFPFRKALSGDEISFIASSSALPRQGADSAGFPLPRYREGLRKGGRFGDFLPYGAVLVQGQGRVPC